MIINLMPGHQTSTLSEDSLTLEQCIEMALKNSDEIAIAQGDIGKAKINLKDARAGYLPEVYLSGGYNLNNIYDRFEWNEDYYSLDISASMTPFRSGRTFLNILKSNESLLSAEQGYQLIKIALILNVIKKYYSLLEIEEILRLKIENLAQKRKHLAFARAQFDLGLVPRADILKAKVDVASTEVDSVQAEGDFRLAQTELNSVMGISLAYPIKIKTVKFIKEEPPDLDSCLNQALRLRPELMQQRATCSIKESDVRLAQLNRLPTFTITGGYNIYVDKFLFEGEPIDYEYWNDNSDWHIGAELTFPIFDAGVRIRAIQSAHINLNKAKLNYEILQREIILEVKLAHLNLVTALEKIALTEKQVEVAEENYNVAMGRYETGVAPITEVVDADVALINSKVNRTKAISDYLFNQAVLKKAMGQLPYQLE